MALSTDLPVGQQEVGGSSLSAGMMLLTANLGREGRRMAVFPKALGHYKPNKRKSSDNPHRIYMELILLITLYDAGLNT